MTEFFPYLRQTIAMFVTADSLGWPLHGTTTGCLTQVPVKPHHQSTREVRGAETRSHRHSLPDYFGPSHRDTELQENWGHEAALKTPFFSLHPPFPSPTLGCIVQERQPASTDLWQCPALLGCPGTSFFGVFCNTVNWIYQISQNWHPQPRSPNCI